MIFLFANNAISSIAGAIDNSQTVFNLQGTTGAIFPNPVTMDDEGFVLCLYTDPAGPFEIVHVTARDVDEVTVLRAQEGTTARAWPDGANAELRLTKETMESLGGGGGGGSAPSTQIVYGTGAGLSSSSTFTYNNATGEFNVEGPGNGSISITAGSITITSPSAEAASDDDGANLQLIAGNGDGTGAGGSFSIQGGTGGPTGDAGTVALTGGDSTVNEGGSVTLTGGSSEDDAGGEVNIIGGISTDAGGGNVNITGGAGDTGGGDVIITTGAGTAPGSIMLNNGFGTAIRIPGDSGNIEISGSSVGTEGNNVWIHGGASTSGQAGDVLIECGVTDSGIEGGILLTTSHGDSIRVAGPTGHVDITGGDDVPGTITLTGGTGPVEGGNVVISGGIGTTDVGGVIQLFGGNTSDASADGGSISITGGESIGGTAGALSLTGGAGTSTGSNGGAITITGGAGNVDGASVTLEGGAGDTTGQGGDVEIYGGSTNSSSNSGGSIVIQPGTNDSNTDNGSFTLVSGSGSPLLHIAGDDALSGSLIYTDDTFATPDVNTLPTSLTVKTYVDAQLLTALVTPMGAAVSLSGTEVTFTDIPAGVKKITVTVVGMSLNAGISALLQLGEAGASYATTSYAAAQTTLVDSDPSQVSSSTTGFELRSANGANVIRGSIILTRHDESTNVWVAHGIFNFSNSATVLVVSGDIALAGEIDRLRLVSANGTATFDAGTANVSYEL